MKRITFAKSLFLFLVAGLIVWRGVSQAWAAGPTGAGPNDALMVPTDWVAIAPNTTLWFYFDYAPLAVGARARPYGGRPAAQVSLDANGVDGLAFSIYTPDQANGWNSDSTTQPAAQGTPLRTSSNGATVHDLYWAGGFNTAGRYLIAVSNTRSLMIMFSLNVTGETVQLYPPKAAVPTPRLPVPLTVTPAPTGTITGKVVFETATGGEIWTVNGNGSNLTRVSNGIDPSWSSDGKQIVFSRWDNTNPGLFIASADGSNERLVFGAPRIRWPRMSPDGKYIAFSQDKSRSDKETLWKLGVIDVATGKLSEPQCSSVVFVPTWGKDSATIFYNDPNFGILKTNIFQGQSTPVGPTGTWWDSTANASRPILNWSIENTEVSPDGTRIVYSMEAHDRWELNLMSTNGGASTGITSPDRVMTILLDVVDHNVAPTWSDDSRQILFLSDRKGKWEFYAMNADGSGLVQVLKNVTDKIPLNFAHQNERMMDWIN